MGRSRIGCRALEKARLDLAPVTIGLPTGASPGLLLASVILALVVATGVLPARAAGLSKSEHRAALQSGVVGAPVLAALDAGENPRVVIALSPESEPSAGTPRDPNFRNAQTIAAIAARQERIITRFAAGEFDLRHRYRAVDALAGRLNPEGLRRLIGDSSVERIDLDEGGSGNLVQATALVKLDAVFGMGKTGAGIQVAVIDSGIDLAHADLQDAVIGQQCFCSGNGGCCPNGSSTQSGPESAGDDHGHGTNVSGILTSNGGIAPRGGAPDAEIVAVKVLDSSNSFCCTSDVIAALDWIILDRPDVDVVNMSLGTYATFEGDCDQAGASNMALSAAINTLRANGVLTVASTGNNGLADRMKSPACIANSISVGAVYDDAIGPAVFSNCTDSMTQADQVVCFSNSNDKTDLLAPGAPTSSTGLGGGTSTYLGTSQAAPLVASCVATLFDSDPSLTPDEIEDTLEATGVTVVDAKNGLGVPRIDCAAAHAAFELCGNGAIDAGELCDDGNTVSWDGCSEACETETAWSVFGIAQGGTIDLTIAGVTLWVVTVMDQTADQVAANVMQTINDDPTLQVLGVSAIVIGNVVTTNGALTNVSINDPGLADAVRVPTLTEWGGSAVFVLLLAASVTAIGSRSASKV